MSEYLVVLGRQPEISIAEMERLYGADKILPFSSLCFSQVEPQIERLGGIPKVAKVVGYFQQNKLQPLDQSLLEVIKNHLDKQRKTSFGISSHIEEHSQKLLVETGIKLKKRLGSLGLRARYVPNKEKILSTAQVWHNKLDRQPNMELILASHEDKILVAQTIAVQNIASYAQRDREKPGRDSRVGMLPPKLAKIMINLAGLPSGTILDPFCGSATVLMEALLMGYDVYGSDNSSAMVDMAEENIKWLLKHYPTSKLSHQIEHADAQDYRWQIKFDAVVSEVYLGPPINKIPSDIEDIVVRINLLLRASLRNFARQLPKGTAVVLAIPAWYNQTSQQYIHLPIIDEIDDLKYNLVDFSHVDNKKLIYRRPDQVVARQILIMERK